MLGEKAVVFSYFNGTPAVSSSTVSQYMRCSGWRVAHASDNNVCFARYGDDFAQGFVRATEFVAEFYDGIRYWGLGEAGCFAEFTAELVSFLVEQGDDEISFDHYVACFSTS